MSKLEFKVFADIEFEGCWRVEARDEETKEVFIALFSGPDCERLAHEYEAFRNGKHPAAKSIPAPSPGQSDTVLLTMVDGEELLIRPKDLSWTFGKQRSCLKGVPKPAIQRLGVKGKK